MPDEKNISNNDELFAYIVDTPKEAIEQHKKGECFGSRIQG